MNIDSTISISIVFATIALISPIITTIINNRYQIKLKKLDMYEEAKRNALSDFIVSAQASILNSDNDEEVVLNYTSSFDKLFIYFSKISIETIKPFDKARAEANQDCNAETLQNANRELSKLIFTLSKQISKK